MREEYYAHTSSHGMEKLVDHLRLVGRLAASNGSRFNCENLCKQLGLLHDIGKHTDRFQEVLERKNFKQDHAIVAGIFYENHGLVDNQWIRDMMSLVMGCHHSYLYSDSSSFSKTYFKESKLTASDDDIVRITRDSEKKVCVKSSEEYDAILNYVTDNDLLLSLTKDDYPDISQMSINEKCLFARMCLSCLVDADYSATASFEDDQYLKKYVFADLPSFEILRDKFDKYYQKFEDDDTAEMNVMRRHIFDVCSDAGSTLSDGSLYTLTLSLMSFALNKAISSNKDHIIIVLPYLSIINQNANIYADIFGFENVLVDDSQTEYTDDSRVWSDRWSSRIIVTTSVKFFETMFASKCTDLRRLHSLTNSVIVFDEYQTLPSEYISSSLELLQSLTKYYNSSVLLSSATNPSYQYRNTIRCKPLLYSGRSILLSKFEWNAVEILYDHNDIFLKYNELHNLSTEFKENMAYADLCDYFPDSESVLYVLNTTKKARDMFTQLCNQYGSDRCYLISSRICSADREDIITEINKSLYEGKVIKVASTQCIEAGVDIDFPNVAREIAPMESIIQTAGRVNRNCKSNGRFLIFGSEHDGVYDFPSASYRNASVESKILLTKDDHFYDFDVLDKYYSRLYSLPGFCSDADILYKGFADCDFKTIDDNYKFIPDKNLMNVIIPNDNCRYLIDDILQNDYTITKSLMRSLSSYSVSVYLSKKYSLDNYAIRLSFRKCRDSKIYTNWYLLRDENCYSACGLDFSDSNNGVFL